LLPWAVALLVWKVGRIEEKGTAELVEKPATSTG
jgi:hypothetical protein